MWASMGEFYTFYVDHLLTLTDIVFKPGKFWSLEDRKSKTLLCIAKYLAIATLTGCHAFEEIFAVSSISLIGYLSSYLHERIS